MKKQQRNLFFLFYSGGCQCQTLRAEQTPVEASVHHDRRICREALESTQSASRQMCSASAEMYLSASARETLSKRPFCLAFSTTNDENPGPPAFVSSKQSATNAWSIMLSMNPKFAIPDLPTSILDMQIRRPRFCRTVVRHLSASLSSVWRGSIAEAEGSRLCLLNASTFETNKSKVSEICLKEAARSSATGMIVGGGWLPAGPFSDAFHDPFFCSFLPPCCGR